MKEKLLENKKVIIVLIVFLLLSVSGLTLAYFVGQIGPAATTNVNLTTKTVDNLTFTTGNDITIGPVNQANFAQGSGNKSGSTTAKATLKANTGNNSATEHYNVYLKINTNTFEYTTANNTAELVLKVTNPAGNTQTISNLTQVTSGGITGYDITNKVSIIPIATDYTITTTSTKTDTWTAQVYFVNLNSDQEVNSAKTFNAELVIEKRDPITVTFDANGGTVSQTSKEVTYGTNYGTLPTPTKSGATFLGWNGKNKFDLDSISGLGKATIHNNNIYLDGSDVEGNTTNSFQIQHYNNGAYVKVGYYIVNNNISEVVYNFKKDNTLDKFNIKLNTSKSDPYFNFFLNNITNNNDYVLSLKIYKLDFIQVKATISNIQLEEGSTATLYEPYYVTSDTAVTQESDHTLTAVWG